jgi:hypothetical protein
MISPQAPFLYLAVCMGVGGISVLSTLGSHPDLRV